MQKRIILLSVFVGLLILSGFIMLYQRRGKHLLEITVVPENSTVLLNGQKTGSGKHYLEPDRYTITATLENFEDNGRVIELNEDQRVSILLTPSNDEGRAVAEKYRDEYLKAEAQQAQEAQAEGISFIENNPIIKNLPHETSYYKINYGISRKNENRAVVYVDSKSALGRRVAIEKIYSWGFDPTNIEVVFRPLNNPFAGAGR